MDAHTPPTGDSDEPRSSLTSTAPCSPACAATRPGQGDANGQQYGPGGPATAGSGRPHNRRRSGRRQQAVTPDSQPRLSGQARGRAPAHPQSPTSKTSCGPRRAGATTGYPGGPVAHPATTAVTTTRPGISGTSRHTHDPTPGPPGHSPISTLQSLRRRNLGGPAAGPARTRAGTVTSSRAGI